MGLEASVFPFKMVILGGIIKLKERHGGVKMQTIQSNVKVIPGKEVNQVFEGIIRPKDL
jgi:hypothetical protein